MKKSVYSLVLNDDIVSAIDQAAYEMGASRSGLINKILADYVSYTTPEQKMQNIFEEIGRMMRELDSFKILSHASPSMLSVQSALRYKYNPTVRYSVELITGSQQTVGRLRVLFRTQSAQLLSYLDRFFGLWTDLEKVYLDNYFYGGVECMIEDGRMNRLLKMPKQKNYDASTLSKAIASYIQSFDCGMKLFFSSGGDQTAVRQLQSHYKSYMETNQFPL